MMMLLGRSILNASPWWVASYGDHQFRLFPTKVDYTKQTIVMSIMQYFQVVFQLTHDMWYCIYFLQNDPRLQISSLSLNSASKGTRKLLDHSWVGNGQQLPQNSFSSHFLMLSSHDLVITKRVFSKGSLLLIVPR